MSLQGCCLQGSAALWSTPQDGGRRAFFVSLSASPSLLHHLGGAGGAWGLASLSQAGRSPFCVLWGQFSLSVILRPVLTRTQTGGRLLAVTRVPSPPCQQPRRLLAVHRIAAIPTFFLSSRSVECCDVVTSVLPELCCKIRP